jgi:hypothetical protein
MADEAETEDGKKKARLERREKRKATKAADALAKEEKKKARLEKQEAKKAGVDTPNGEDKKKTRLERREKRKAKKVANALAKEKKKKSRLKKRKAKKAGVADSPDAEEKKKARLERREKRKAAKASAPTESGATDSDAKTKARRERRQKLMAARAAAAEKKAGQRGKEQKAEGPVATKKEPPVFQLQPTEEEFVASFAALDTLVLSGLPRHRFVVDVTGVAFHAYFQRSEYSRLFVMLGGEAPKDRKSATHFERRAWGEMLPGSVLWISDPTLDLSNEISLGWYVGTRDKDYTAEMAKLVARVAADLGVARSDIIFYGGSGGGFAALMCARFLPGVNCIVINPQIDLSKHEAEHRRKLAKVFSGEENFKAIAHAHPERVSVLAAFPEPRNLPPLVYVQNRQDKEHFDAHYALFCETYSAPKEGGISDNGHVLTLLFEHGEGHVHEPRPIVRPLLAQALAFFDQFRKSKK